MKCTIFNSKEDTSSGQIVEFNPEIILKHDWSPIVFDGPRHGDNFDYCEIFVVDIDNKLSIEDAVHRVKDYNYVIASSKSHQKKKKSGNRVLPPCDRFRVILPLDRAARTIEEYELLKQQAILLFPELDSAAFNTAQYFYKCTSQVFYDEWGSDSPFQFKRRGRIGYQAMKSIRNPPMEGERHNARTQIAFDMKAQGYEQYEVEAVLERMGPDFVDGHGIKSLNNIFKTEPRISKRELNSDFPFLEAGFFEAVQGKSGSVRLFPKFNEFSEYMKKGMKFISLQGKDYVFGDTHYKFLYDAEFGQLIIKLTKGQAKVSQIEEFKRYARQYCFVKDFESGVKGKINFLNGVLDIATGSLLPHSPEYHFTSVVPHNYDPEAECPEFIKFLDSCFYREYLGKDNIPVGAIDKETIKTLQQYAGYCLLGGPQFLHKCLVCIGDGRNGKSTYINAIADMVGRDNTSYVSMRKVTHEFSAVMMDGKAINIDEEIKEIDAETFKLIVGGGLLNVSHKGKDQFAMKCDMRLLCSANSVPKIRDVSIGLLDRMIMVPFDRYFDENERDSDLSDKIKNEIPGIINWALIGLVSVLESSKIHESKACLVQKDNYMQQSNSVYYFIKNYCKIDKSVYNGRRRATDFYDLYQNTMERKVRYLVSIAEFQQRFKRDLKKFLIKKNEHPAQFIKEYESGTFYHNVSFK